MARKKKETYRSFFNQFSSSEDEKIRLLFEDEFDYTIGNVDEEVLPTDYIVTTTDFGSCEGIYIDFYAKRDTQRVRVGTAKTLSQTDEAFVRMHTRAAQMTLVLNKELARRYDIYYKEEVEPLKLKYKK